MDNPISNSQSPSWTWNRRLRNSNQEAPPSCTPPQVWSTLDPFPSEQVDLAGCCSRSSPPPRILLTCFPSRRQRRRPSWRGFLQRDNCGEPRREKRETWGRGGGNARGNLPPEENKEVKVLDYMKDKIIGRTKKDRQRQRHSPASPRAWRPLPVLPDPASHPALAQNPPTWKYCELQGFVLYCKDLPNNQLSNQPSLTLTSL